jgi:peptidoglycan/LPS O-acetylase OafA/YrhL
MEKIKLDERDVKNLLHADRQKPNIANRSGNASLTRSLPLPLKNGLLSSQLPAIDGLRAVAVLMVVFYHFGFAYAPGGLGVLIFFVLSGFLITWLLLKEDERFRSVSLTNFYSRRALRIFPAFYCYWLLYVLLVTLRHHYILWSQAWSSFFYVNNYFQALHGDPNTGLSHTWSLGIEEQFYLLWAPAFLLLRKDRKQMTWVLASLIAAIWLYRELRIFAFGTWQGYIYEAFDTRADHLLIGCLLAVLLRSEFASKFWKAMCSNVLVSMPVLLLLMSSAACEYFYGAPYRDAVAFVIDPILVAILIAQVIAFRESIVWGWLNLAWVRYLGRVSYSIYLYQQIVVGPVRKILAAYPMAVQLAATMIFVILTASASYYFVERPFLKMKERFNRKPAIA